MMGSSRQEPEPLQIVFHGTISGNVSSILQKGMLPEQHSSRGHWFAGFPETSIPYCRVSSSPYRLILFLLLPEELAVLRRDGDIIVLSDSRCALPLGTVTVC